jgi:hypothetical protein
MVKLFMYRHLGLQEVQGPRISRKSTQEGGKVVSPASGITLVFIAVRG